MPTITKSDLVDGIAEAVPEVSKSSASRVLDVLFERIGAELAAGNEVRIRGLGTLSVKERAASEGRHPRTGEKIQIAASRTVGFKVGKGLRDRLNGGQGQAEAAE